MRVLITSPTLYNATRVFIITRPSEFASEYAAAAVSHKKKRGKLVNALMAERKTALTPRRVNNTPRPTQL